MNLDVVFDYDTGFPGYNLFAYCGNSPVFRIDVSGKDSDKTDEGDITDDDMRLLGGGGDGIPPCPPSSSGCTGGLPVMTGQPTIRNKDTVDYTQIKSAGKVGPDDPIYRYGGTTPDKCYPGPNDIEGNPKPGVSFSGKYKPGSGITTMRALNDSGFFYAVNDKGTHIAVFPRNGSLAAWYHAGLGHLLTQILYDLINKE